jgi:hypothetical protein
MIEQATFIYRNARTSPGRSLYLAAGVTFGRTGPRVP